ncbi:MAG: hypothetical protein IKU15_02130 [Clostridia bacterium]|nr:hypothetical protein [Clostridia bacterium]
MKRTFPGKGAVQVLPFDTVEQLLWDNGFQYMIKSGQLYIDDMQTKIDLGLENPDAKVPTNIKVLTPEQILTLLKVRTVEEFKKEVSTISVEQCNEIVKYAVENNLVDNDKVNYLRERTGKDVIAMIARKRLEAEAEKANAGKEEKRPEGVFSPV